MRFILFFREYVPVYVSTGVLSVPFLYAAIPTSIGSSRTQFSVFYFSAWLLGRVLYLLSSLTTTYVHTHRQTLATKRLTHYISVHRHLLVERIGYENNTTPGARSVYGVIKPYFLSQFVSFLEEIDSVKEIRIDFEDFCTASALF